MNNNYFTIKSKKNLLKEHKYSNRIEIGGGVGMKDASGKMNTFVVKIIQTQNKSWQGMITWADKNETQYFRSALELMHMIQEVVEVEDDTKTSN